MDVKKTLVYLKDTVGVSKVKISEITGANIKMVNSILNSRDGDYIVSKINRPRAMEVGTALEEDCK